MAMLKMLWIRLVTFLLSFFQPKELTPTPTYTPGPILPPPITIPDPDVPTVPKIPSAPPVLSPPVRPPMVTKPIVKYTADHSDGFYLALADGFINQLHTDPHYVLAIMANESGLRANAYNPAGPAYGLIQFLGSGNAYIANLSAEEQVPHVIAYYHGHAPYGSIGEVYAETFLPARMLARGRSLDTVLTVKGEAFYDENEGLDYNHDGQITIGDLENQANAAAKALGPRFVEATARLDWAIASLGLTPPGGFPVGALVAGVAVALALFGWKV